MCKPYKMVDGHRVPRTFNKPTTDAEADDIMANLEFGPTTTITLDMSDPSHRRLFGAAVREGIVKFRSK